MQQTLKMPVLGEPEFRRLQKIMADASGIQMAPNKISLVAGRLMKRLRHYRLESFVDYLHLLDQPMYRSERRLVIDLLTTNETYFFREHPHFDFLGNWVARSKGPLRIWSAACSSGEEPYSVAMVLSEHCTSADWSIVASDLSLSMLEKAREAIYDMGQAKYFPEGWMQRYCLSGVGDMDGLFRMQIALRDKVRLREVNIVQPLPEDLGHFDVVLLRNVLIYFDVEEKQRIVKRMVAQLRPGGLLFIGHAESIHGFDLPVRLVHPSVFERI